MTYEEAELFLTININHDCDSCMYECDEETPLKCTEFELMMRELLKKQIPKPRGWDKCNGEYVCPHCGKPLLFDFDQVYCHRCGGALSEEE